MAPRIVAWVLLGLLVIVLVSWGSTALSGHKPQTDDHPAREIGRFQLVRQTPEEIILLDTTYGRLYKAKPDDIQPYSDVSGDEESKDAEEE